MCQNNFACKVAKLKGFTVIVGVRLFYFRMMATGTKLCEPHCQLGKRKFKTKWCRSCYSYGYCSRIQ